MAAELWICDVLELTIEAECIRYVLASGKKRIVLRGSRSTLVKLMVMGKFALAGQQNADVLSLPKHR
jgi:hypothetical protein